MGGWKNKAEHNRRQLTISGESGEVKGKTADYWKDLIPESIDGHSVKETSGTWVRQAASGGHCLTKV